MHVSYTRENILPKWCVSWAVLACRGLFHSDLLSPVMVAKTYNNIVRSTTFLSIKKSRNRQRDPSKTWPCLASIHLRRGQAGHPWCCPRSAGRTTETRVYCFPRLNEFDHSFYWICKKKIQKTERKSYISKTPSLFFPTPFVPPQTRCRGRAPFSADHWFCKCLHLLLWGCLMLKNIDKYNIF